MTLSLFEYSSVAIVSLYVQENVGDNKYLQEQLVELLMCRSKNDEALYWADKFSIPDDQLPEAVLDVR